ncbi:MAG: Stp1/IreP family PP2C-type Ser/Thr phosphatase [Gammaproteobacteria bacterium]
MVPKLRGAIQVAGKSHTGQVRDHNEDFIDWDVDLGLIVLADGMGGAKAGEVASELAVKTTMDHMRAGIDETGSLENVAEGGSYTAAGELLQTALATANTTVFNVSQSQPQYSGMGTTGVAVLFHDNSLSIAYVGDSRLYRFREGELGQMTEDHTMINELVKRGFYTPEQARTAVNKNVLTRAIGVGDAVEIDVFEEPASAEDIYLFCSDGLSDMVEDEQIASILRDADGNIDAGVEALVQAANDNGGVDNVSVILVKVIKPYPAKRGWRQRLVDWIF